MKHPIRILAGLLLAGLALIQTSCNEDAIIKSNLSNSGIGDAKLDDFTILSKTVYDDTIRTNPVTSGAIVLGVGTVNDPQFGRTNAGIYFQVVPTKGNFNFSDNIEAIDSAFVVLRTATHWGDTTGPAQTFTVYKLTDNLNRDDVNYSFTFKNFDPTPVSEGTVTRDIPSLIKDSVLRIPLTDAFINELRDAALNSGDNTAFLSKIKGLFVKTGNEGRTLNYYVMNGTSDLRRAAIQFFFREKGSAEVKTAFFNFDPTACGYSNYITRDYNGTLAQQKFNSTQQSDDVVLLQGEPGAAIDLRITGLNRIPVAVVNRASLTLTQVLIGNDDVFTPPPSIIPIGIDANGQQYLLADQLPATSANAAAFVGGSQQSINLNGVTLSSYTVNIPREIQSIVAKRGDELHLHINSSRLLFGAYRMAAGGGNPGSENRVKLEVVYSKLN